MAKSKPPVSLSTVTTGEVQALIEQLRQRLDEPTFVLVEGLLNTLLWIMEVLADHKASLGRLRRMLFGPKTEKAGKLLPKKQPATKPDPASGKKKGKRPGHGRRKAGEYTGAKRIPVPHPALKAGSLCDKCKKGKLYLKGPVRLIRVVAQPMFQGLMWELERLRCALCGAIFTAPAPPQALLGKYDPSVGLMLAIERYGAGKPMYRIEKWQQYFGVPLPASTQWELIKEASATPAIVYRKLMELGAQGTLIHNDDTPMRVKSLGLEIAAQEEGGRTGVFTTSLLSHTGSHRIGLFMTGRRHAGENLDLLLQRRDPALEEPLQMCDALARNLPKQGQTLECNCLAHGRRQFVDQIENFPEECSRVIGAIGEVYHREAQIQEAKLPAQERLLRHQEQSGPVMEDLKQWMDEQIDQKKVEPNSGLGQAIGYLRNHWEALTQFLRIPGAPLDNNVCERALKMAILHRKNSLSYKTLGGAEVGDIFMSLIHTCQLNGANPFDYLSALQQHARRVEEEPALWTPWIYRDTIAALDSG
jgi:transposase